MLGLGASLLSPYVEGVAPYSNTKSLQTDSSNTNGVNTNYDPQTLLRSSNSFSFWMRPAQDGQPSPAQYIFGERNTGATNIHTIELTTSGSLLQRFYSNGSGVGNISITASSSSLFSDGANADFKHIVIVKDYSGSNVDSKLYVDGSEVSFTPMGGLTVTVANAQAYDSGGRDMAIDGVFQDANLTSGFGTGMIDEFAVFTKALSPSEVTAIYNSGTPKDESGHDGLELYYRFEDDLTDTAGTSDGTAVGTATFSTSTP